MISQTAEYALRAIVYLADKRDTPRTVAQIAEVTKVPAGYLAKVMQNLTRASLARSQRGLKGGFTLARTPSELTILEIVQAVDPIRRFPECPLGIPSHGRRLCPLHSRLDEAAEALENAFAETTVSDLLAPVAGSQPLCAFPAVSGLSG